MDTFKFSDREVNESKGVMFVLSYNQHIDYAAMCAHAIERIHRLRDTRIAIAYDSEQVRLTLEKELGIRPRHKTKNTLPDRLYVNAKEYVLIKHEGQKPIRPNIRRWNDYQESFEFNNLSRMDAYWLSPFKTTLLLDADFLVNTRNGVLSSLDQDVDFACGTANTVFTPLGSSLPSSLQYVNGEHGLTTAWATAVLMRRSPFCTRLFKLFNYVRQHYTYFAKLYGFSSALFRNDFALSVALKMAYGNSVVPEWLWFRYVHAMTESIVSLGPITLDNRGVKLEYEVSDVHAVHKKSLLECITGIEVELWLCCPHVVS
jgi:hypothetical protein